MSKKKLKTNEDYLKVFQKELDEARYERIIRQQIKKAEGGDARAARLIIEHAQGKPAQRIEVYSRQDEALSQIQKLLAQEGQPVQWQIVDKEMEESD